MMIDYVAICELAQTPIIATIVREVRSYPSGAQFGMYSMVMAPGNCTGGAILITIWPGGNINLAGFEANDNTIGAVR